MSEVCPACLALNNICKKLNDKKCEELVKKLEEIRESSLPESEKEKLYKQLESEFLDYIQNKSNELGQKLYIIISDSIKEAINNKK